MIEDGQRKGLISKTIYQLVDHSSATFWEKASPKARKSHGEAAAAQLVDVVFLGAWQIKKFWEEVEACIEETVSINCNIKTKY